jgi:predicted glutamine amidotransferase
MCRLFGMSGGPRAVQATFWLLDAPHSLATQSRREPDGTGLGHFAESGAPCVLITQEELWALRYPDSDHLYVLEREPGGPHGDRHADHASASGRIRVRSHDLRETAAVVVASERMDEDPGWRLLEPGEMVHVDGSLRVTTHQAVDGPPERRIRLEDLGERAIAAAQPGP